MTLPLPPCRLFGLFAGEAPRVVIFRRGPSRHVRLILWDTDTDTFELGQWFTGSLYVNAGSLSPDGRYLVYGAADYRGPHCTWVAVSRPPYLTAVSFWMGEVHLGEGSFGSKDRLYLSGGPESTLRQDADPKRPWPAWLTVAADTQEAWEQRQRKGVWQQVPQADLPGRGDDVAHEGSSVRPWRRALPSKAAFLQRSEGDAGPKGPRARDRYTLHLPDRTAVELDAEQADFDQAGRLVVFKRGQVWVGEVGDGAEVLDLRLLADFNEQRFEAIAAPEWATRW